MNKFRVNSLNSGSQKCDIQEPLKRFMAYLVTIYCHFTPQSLGLWHNTEFTKDSFIYVIYTKSLRHAFKTCLLKFQIFLLELFAGFWNVFLFFYLNT